MEKAYSYQFKCPNGTHSYESDSLKDMLSTALTDLSRLVLAEDISPTNTVEEKIAKYEESYLKNNNRQCSPIIEAGFLPVVIDCYVKGMRIKDTVLHLAEQHSFKTSCSPVGRLWVRFKQLGFAKERAFKNQLTS